MSDSGFYFFSQGSFYVAHFFCRGCYHIFFDILIHSGKLLVRILQQTSLVMVSASFLGVPLIILYPLPHRSFCYPYLRRNLFSAHLRFKEKSLRQFFCLFFYHLYAKKEHSNRKGVFLNPWWCDFSTMKVRF